MKPAPFEYARPSTIHEAISLLASHDNAKVLAGGQTLGPMLNLRLAQPALLVDVTRIPELVRIETTTEAITLGACVTHAVIEDGRVPDPGDQALIRVAAGIAYRAIRTRGTIGGSLAHADPAADWLSVLIALEADIMLQGPSGERSMPVARFVTGPMMTVLAETELVTAIRVPRLSSGARVGYSKICRKTGEFAEAIGVAVFEPERGRLRLVGGAMDGAPAVIETSGHARTRNGAPPGRAFREDIVSGLRNAGLGHDVYDLNVHSAALERAIDEVLVP